MFRLFGVIILVVVVLSCAPPRPIDEGATAAYRQLYAARAEQLSSAAYLVDLRLTSGGRKYSVTTELYYSGDTIGIHGRGLFGKSAYRGRLIDDTAVVYFPAENQYFSAPLVTDERFDSCDRSGEVLLYVLSLLGGASGDTAVSSIRPSSEWGKYQSGRFDIQVRLTDKGYPRQEIRVDHQCGDSIAITYRSEESRFPFYRPHEILYANKKTNFRAKGYIREQKYNIAIPVKKFVVTVPANAARIDSL